MVFCKLLLQNLSQYLVKNVKAEKKTPEQLYVFYNHIKYFFQDFVTIIPTSKSFIHYPI